MGEWVLEEDWWWFARKFGRDGGGEVEGSAEDEDEEEWCEVEGARDHSGIPGRALIASQAAVERGGESRVDLEVPHPASATKQPLDHPLTLY